MKLYAGSSSYLYSFFSNLRRAGFPLGIDDYQLLLQAIRSGFAVDSKDQLLQLCKRLWLKSLFDESDFNHHFKMSFAGLPDDLLVRLKEEKKKEEKEKKEEELLEGKEGEEEAKEKDEEETTAPDTEEKENPLEEETITEYSRDEVASMQIVTSDFRKQSAAIEAEAQRQYGLVRDYIPITQRSLLSMWRYLQLPEGVPQQQEIDINATVLDIYRSGFFLHPKYKETRPKNRLSILIDQGGSMVAFQALANRIATTAGRANALRNVEQYYFHNVPAGKYLFKDSKGLERYMINHLLAHSSGQHDALLIISDAGAARGRSDSERIIATTDFLEKANKVFEHIVWINPMPRYRWRRTSASILSRYVDMFAASETEVKKAIKKLQGRL